MSAIDLFYLVNPEMDVVDKCLASCKESARRMLIGRNAYTGLASIVNEVLSLDEFLEWRASEAALNSFENASNEC